MMKIRTKKLILTARWTKPKIPLFFGIRKRRSEDKKIIKISLLLITLEITIEKRFKSLATSARETARVRKTANRDFQNKENLKLKAYDARSFVHKQVKSSYRRGNR